MRIRSRGFSLIELLVALAIFSTMAAISYVGLSSVARVYGTMDEREQDLAQLGRTLTMIERDLRSIARRGIRDASGQPLPALMGAAERLELSSHGRGRAAGQDTGLIERIGYVRDQDDIQRVRWPVLDRAASSRPDQRPILADVRSLRWRFLGVEGRWHEQWPPRGGAGVDADWPRAVEAVLQHERIGEIRRLIELPEP